MRHRAAAFGSAEVRAGGENGPISRRKSPSNGRPECSCDASLAAKHEIQARLIGKKISSAGATYFKSLEVATSKGTCGQPGYRYHRLAASMRRACSPGMGSRAASTAM